MAEQRGWLLDLYADEAEGVIVWFLAEDGRRCRFTLSMPTTFYAARSSDRLRAAWRHLRDGVTAKASTASVSLARCQREDLFAGLLDVMAVQVGNPALQAKLFPDLCQRFPDLDYYDADIPLWLRVAAAYAVFPLAYCELVVAEDGRIQHITPLETPWQLEPSQPPLRLMTIEPDVVPLHAEPTWVRVCCGRMDNRIPLQPWRLIGCRRRRRGRRYS